MSTYLKDFSIKNGYHHNMLQCRNSCYIETLLHAESI